jgi:hypothetical protein
MNAGDTAWVLMSTGLVMVMVPGLALFYGAQQLSTPSTSTVQLADSGSDGCTWQSQAHDRQVRTSQHESARRVGGVPCRRRTAGPQLAVALCTWRMWSRLSPDDNRRYRAI